MNVHEQCGEIIFPVVPKQDTRKQRGRKIPLTSVGPPDSGDMWRERLRRRIQSAVGHQRRLFCLRTMINTSRSRITDSPRAESGPPLARNRCSNQVTSQGPGAGQSFPAGSFPGVQVRKTQISERPYPRENRADGACRRVHIQEGDAQDAKFS